MGLIFFKYLYIYDDIYNDASLRYSYEFEKDCLVNKLQKDLLYINFDKKIVEDFISKYFELFINTIYIIYNFFLIIKYI